MSMLNMFKRREIFIGIFALVSVLLVVYQFFAPPQLKQVNTDLTFLSTYVTQFSFIYTGIVVAFLHIRTIRKQGSEWYFSLLSLSGYLFIPIYFWAPWFYKEVMSVMLPAATQGSMSLMGFYSVLIYFQSAIGVRSASVALLLVGSIFGLISNMPVGMAVSPLLYDMGVWLRAVPSNGANAACVIGIGIGICALFIRTVLGYEKAYLGEA